MGEVRARLILENQDDRVLAEAGHLDLTRVRRVELDALVDTGAVMTLLPQEVVEALGLPLDGNIIVTLANESRVELPRARLLSLSSAAAKWTPIASSVRPSAKVWSDNSCLNASISSSIQSGE